MPGSNVAFNRLWVFSDLHLMDPGTSFYQSFLKSLEEPDSESDVVVLAGDIFDIFIGNSGYFKQKHAQFFQAIEKLYLKKVKIYYIQGNHDFQLEQAFPRDSVEVVDSELILGKVYIAHGDLVDQSDHGYLLMRKLFRSWGFRRLLNFFPGKAIEKIGESIARSHDKKEKDLALAPGEVPRVRPLYRSFAEEKKRQGFDFIILGHCHDLDDLQPFYFNMGYPPVHRQFLFYSSESNSFKRRVFVGI